MRVLCLGGGVKSGFTGFGVARNGDALVATMRPPAEHVARTTSDRVRQHAVDWGMAGLLAHHMSTQSFA